MECNQIIILLFGITIQPNDIWYTENNIRITPKLMLAIFSSLECFIIAESNSSRVPH
jgi:hypothetical protein